MISLLFSRGIRTNVSSAAGASGSATRSRESESFPLREGESNSIDTDFHRPMDCEFCGQCLDTCPVGAITSDRFDYHQGLGTEETTTPCPYCGCGCLLTIGSKDGEIKRVFSDPCTGPE